MSGPCHILHVITTLEIGGEQRYLARIATGLARLGVRQTVAFSGGDALAGELPLEVARVRFSVDKPSARRPRDWPMALTFLGMLRRDPAQVVATHSPGLPQLAASLAARLVRVPVVHTIQRAYGNRSPTEDVIVRHGLLRRVAYGLTDRFVALGSYYQTDQQERYRIPADKIVRSTIGVDLDGFRPDAAARAAVRRELGLPADALVLGIVARQERVKGIDRGLEVCAALRAHLPSVRMIIVGDGPARAENEARARALGLEPWVSFLGARTDAARVMSAFDAFVQTTRNPLNGIASIEAMAVGNLIITVVDDVEEERMAADTCDESANGLFFRPADAAGSAARAAAVLGDPEAVRQRGQASRRMALERFDLDRHVAELCRLYVSLQEPS